MQRPTKVKAAAPMPMRKSVMTGTAAARRAFPAWIAADEADVAFSAAVVTKRVRDALVLRTVAKRKSASGKGTSDVSGA